MAAESPEDPGTELPPEAAAPPAERPAQLEAEHAADRGQGRSTMIPARAARLQVEAVFMRVVATGGIVGIGVAIAAIIASQHVQGWIIGLVVSLWSVLCAAILWSSRRM